MRTQQLAIGKSTVAIVLLNVPAPFIQYAPSQSTVAGPRQPIIRQGIQTA